MLLTHITATDLGVPKTRDVPRSPRAAATPGDGCGRDRVLPLPLPGDAPRQSGLDCIVGLERTEGSSAGAESGAPP